MPIFTSYLSFYVYVLVYINTSSDTHTLIYMSIKQLRLIYLYKLTLQVNNKNIGDLNCTSLEIVSFPNNIKIFGIYCCIFYFKKLLAIKLSSYYTILLYFYYYYIANSKYAR